MVPNHCNILIITLEQLYGRYAINMIMSLITCTKHLHHSDHQTTTLVTFVTLFMY